MSDYLDSLVTRALQLGPVVQPRLPSLFERRSRAEDAAGAVPLDVRSDDSVLTESPFDVSTPHLTAQPIQQPVPVIAAATGTRISEKEIDAGVEGGSEQLGDPFLQSQPLVQSVPVTAHVLPRSRFLQPDSERTYGLAHEDVTPRSAEMASTMSLSEPETFQPRVREADNVESRSRIEPEIRQIFAADQPEDSTSNAKRRANPIPVNAAVTVPINTTGRVQASESTQGPETVVVTIGRVDVRAVFTQPPAAPRSNRSQQPGPMSLDEYLKQRSEGRR